METFKQWLEHDYLYDDLESDRSEEKSQERLSASGAFLSSTKRSPNPKYDPAVRDAADANWDHFGPTKEFEKQNPDWRDKYDQETNIQIPPQIKLANKRIVCSKYRSPPIAMPISNQSVHTDHHHGRKPFGGLWYAFGSEWIDWSQQFPWRLRMFIHEIIINEDKIEILNNKKDSERFEQDYGVRKNDLQRYEILIDWTKVIKDYSGIEIKSSAMHHIDWQEGWDIASGCIWNNNAIKDTRLLYVYDINNKRYVPARGLGLYGGYSSKAKNPLPDV